MSMYYAGVDVLAYVECGKIIIFSNVELILRCIESTGVMSL